MRLMIVGDGPEKEPLEQLAKELKITDTVVFTGKVVHDELPPYIHTCDIYVTASLSDTNSISMLEGMAGGLPVLQLYDELNADQVKDGVNGCTPPRRQRDGPAPARGKSRDMDPTAAAGTQIFGHPVGQKFGRSNFGKLHPDHLLQHLQNPAAEKTPFVSHGNAFLPCVKNSFPAQKSNICDKSSAFSRAFIVYAQ